MLNVASKLYKQLNNIWSLQIIDERCGNKIAALTLSARSKAQIFWEFDTSQIEHDQAM